MLISCATSEKHASSYNGRAAVLRSLHPEESFYMARMVHGSRLIQIRPDWVSYFGEHHCLLDWARLHKLPEAEVSHSVVNMLKDMALVQVGSKSRKPKAVDTSITFTFQELRKQMANLFIHAVRAGDKNEASEEQLLALVVPGDGSNIFAVRPDDLMVTKCVPAEIHPSSTKEAESRTVKLFKCPSERVRSERIQKWEQHLVRNLMNHAYHTWLYCRSISLDAMPSISIVPTAKLRKAAERLSGASTLSTIIECRTECSEDGITNLDDPEVPCNAGVEFNVNCSCVRIENYLVTVFRSV